MSLCEPESCEKSSLYPETKKYRLCRASCTSNSNTLHGDHEKSMKLQECQPISKDQVVVSDKNVANFVGHFIPFVSIQTYKDQANHSSVIGTNTFPSIPRNDQSTMLTDLAFVVVFDVRVNYRFFFYS